MFILQLSHNVHINTYRAQHNTGRIKQGIDLDSKDTHTNTFNKAIAYMASAYGIIFIIHLNKI